MKEAYPHIIESVEDWPISKFAASRPQFIAQLNAYTLKRILDKNDGDIEQLLSRTIYQERQRVKLNPWKVDPPNEKLYWSKMAKQMKEAAIAENKNEMYLEMLKKILNRYSEEIVSGFNPKTFRFARKFLTAFFKRVFNKAFGNGMFNIWGTRDDLMNKFKVQGYVEEVRELFNSGTVVLVPTHYSNIDSILIGYAIDSKAGLPGFGFAAGLNLFDVEILGYYMSRLGAYRVDRRKKNPIYLETLKAYTSLSVIKGANSLFFPGGTRSRSGMIEQNVKLGLLGSLIDAQDYIHTQNIDNKIIIVPLTLGYHFTLEANSLINQYLVKKGREKYIRVKNKSGKIRKSFKFIRSLYQKETEVILKFGKPFDVFGNDLDEKANSISKSGEVIDIYENFYQGDRAKKDLQRESVYTKKLGDKIIESFKKENVILSSHIVAHVGFKLLRACYKELDLYGILKQPTEDFECNFKDFRDEVEKLRETLIKMKTFKLLDISEVVFESTDACIEHGLKNIGLFHPQRPLFKSNDLIKSESFTLLFYYQNMLDTYEIEY